MSRKRRLEATLRSPQRSARQWRNRQGRSWRRTIRFAIAKAETR
jgi:hypothetical protein